MDNTQAIATLDNVTAAQIAALKARGMSAQVAAATFQAGPSAILSVLEALDSFYTSGKSERMLQAWALIDRARALAGAWQSAIDASDPQESVIVTDLQSTLVHLAQRAPRGVTKDDADAAARLAAIVKVLAAVKQNGVAMRATREGTDAAWDRLAAQASLKAQKRAARVESAKALPAAKTVKAGK